MSRWTVPSLSVMTEQQVFDVCAYHMLAHGGAPRDILLKPASRTYNERRAWGYFVRRKRAPRHAAELIADIETIHRTVDPEQWKEHLDGIAVFYKLEPTK